MASRIHHVRRTRPKRLVMPHDLARMVVVASGNCAEVKRWADSLRTASIGYEVVESVFAPAHAEIWVNPDDAEEARSAIRSSREADGYRLW
jgi:hypothetical protein